MSVAAPVPVPSTQLQPLVVGKRLASGWGVAMLRGSVVLAELEPDRARALAAQLVELADILEHGRHPAL